MNSRKAVHGGMDSAFDHITDTVGEHGSYGDWWAMQSSLRLGNMINLLH